MIIHYMSDLHIEFAAMPELRAEGEVLVLAGDITSAKALDPKRTDVHSRRVRRATHKFLDEAQANFDHVLIIGGNHEPYRLDINEAEQLCRSHLAGRRVQWLENELVVIGDVTFICCTLWTDMDRRNPLSMLDIGAGLNDFHLISNGDQRFSPEMAADRHDASCAFIRAEVTKRVGQKVVVVTHHTPSPLGINRVHSGNGLDGAFASDLSGLIEDHPQIRYWVFGHTHVVRSVQVGTTWLKANCRGYPHERMEFDVNANFAV